MKGRGRPTNSVKKFESMPPLHSKAGAKVIALGMNDLRDITSSDVPNAVA